MPEKPPAPSPPPPKERDDDRIDFEKLYAEREARYEERIQHELRRQAFWSVIKVSIGIGFCVGLVMLLAWYGWQLALLEPFMKVVYACSFGAMSLTALVMGIRYRFFQKHE